MGHKKGARNGVSLLRSSVADEVGDPPTQHEVAKSLGEDEPRQAHGDRRARALRLPTAEDVARGDDSIAAGAALVRELRALLHGVAREAAAAEPDAVSFSVLGC